MHVDLVESLRCPNAHEDGWLVASAHRVVDRRIVEGVIGCPMCGAEWPVRDGVLSLTGERDEPPPSAGPVTVAGDPAEQALRLAALLDLRDARGAIVLTGAAAALSHHLASLTGVLVLAVNPPAHVAHAPSRLLVGGQLPLGVGTMRGVVLDAAHATPEWLASAVRALERSGRLVAPARVAVPAEVEELARDAAEWVGEVRVAASGLVPLRRSGAVP
jgi:uncharacterized protein YbaR (Trm112 family)